jgi:hemerythrin
MQLILSNATYLESCETLSALDQSESLIRDLPTSAVENEHRELIDLINECYEEMLGDVDAEVVRQLIDKIYSAVAEHFLHEEELMQSTAYPEYEAHKKNHDGLLTTLRDKIDRFVKDPDHDVSDLRRSLANWFGRHFSTFDNDLQNYFLAKERDDAEANLIN